VKIEWVRGYRELALLRLRQLAAELPHDAEIARELVTALRAAGRADEARRTNLSFQIAHPTLAGPRITLLQSFREAGETARVDREVEALLRDFAEDSGALQALAEFAGSVGDVALVKRIAARAESRQMALAPFALFAIEAALVAKDYGRALDAIRGYAADGSDWGQRYRALFDSFTAIAQLGRGDVTAARASLDSFLQQPNLRADNLLAVANRLAALGGQEQAWQTLARALEVDPSNQAALTRLIELDLELGRIPELAVHLRQFIKVRRPSPEMLQVVQHRLGSDLWLFSPDVPAALELVRGTLARVADASGKR
jgi:tetratricopeptide (TPR) repeat protein